MAYEIDFESAPHVKIRVHGIDTPEDMISRIRETVSDPRWRPGRGVLIDMREASTAEFSNDDIHGMNDFHALVTDRIGSSKLALVARSGPVFGVTRMWEGLSEVSLDLKVGAFEDIEEAERWLESPSSE